MMNKLLIFALLVSCFSLTAQELRFAEAEDFEDYQTILERARDKDQMLLVVLHRGGGALRDMYNQGVFKQRQVAALDQQYFPVAIDLREPMGENFASVFPPEEVPEFYFLNEDEFLIERAGGFLAADTLVTLAENALSQRHRYDSLLVKYQKLNLSQAEWLELIRLHGLNFNYTETASLAWGFLNGLNDQSLLSAQILPLTVRYGLDLETRYPLFVIEHRKTIEQKLKSFDFNEFFAQTYSYNLDLAIVNQDSVLLEKIIEQLLPHQPAANQKQLTVKTYVEYAKETEDFEKATDGLIRFSEKSTSDSLEEDLFDLAFYIADNYNDSASISSANRLAERASEVKKGYANLMLTAYTHYLLENYDEALKFTSEANRSTSDKDQIVKASRLAGMIRKAQEEKSDK